MKLTSDQLAGIEKQNLANILKKLKAGKTLTAAERMALGGESPEGIAPTLQALSDELGIDRQTVWRKRKADPDTDPGQLAGGGYDVEEWRDWLDSGGTKEERERKKALDVELLKIKIARERVALGHDEEVVLLVTEVEAGVGLMLQGLRVAIENVTPRLARKATGIDDYNDMAEIVDGEMEVLKRTIRKCEFFDSPEPELSADKEPDAPKMTGRKRAKKKVGRGKG